MFLSEDRKQECLSLWTFGDGGWRSVGLKQGAGLGYISEKKNLGVFNFLIAPKMLI